MLVEIIILFSYSSYWESADVISFVLRQLVRCNADLVSDPRSTSLMHHHNTLEMDQPREKWNKKRTSVKIRNGAPNHRANDIIVKEGNSQVVRIYYPFLLTFDSLYICLQQLRIISFSVVNMTEKSQSFLAF